MNPTVFIGGIIERDAGQIEPPKEISSSRTGNSHQTGFPTAQWKSKSLARVVGTANDAKKVPVNEVVAVPSATSSAVHSNNNMSSRNDLGMDDNMRFIMSMSAEELAEAQRELQAMFKPETLEKFKQSAAKKYGSDVQKMMSKSVDETALSLSDHTMMMERPVVSSSLPKQQPIARSSRIDGVDVAAVGAAAAKVVTSGSDDATILYQSMASNLEELKELQRTAPDDVRAALAWAIDDEPTGGENALDRDAEYDTRKVNFDHNTTTAKSVARADPKNRSRKDDSGKRWKSPLVPPRLSQDRFDLKGRKVIQRSECVAQVVATLTDGAYLPSWDVPPAELRALAAAVVDAMVDTVGIAVEHIVLEGDTQPQDELLNHQINPQAPGYNFVEICELYRSQNPSQRLLSLHMLQGILRIRDEVVTLESGYDSHSHTISCGDNVDDDGALDAKGTSTSADGRLLPRAFDRILRLATAAILKAQCGGGSLGGVGAGSAMDRASFNGIKWHLTSEQEQTKLRRVLTHALLHLCASDLPTGLPTLLAWGIQQPRLPATTALATAQCLKAYLVCQREEDAADQLWDGFWGALGAPGLPMPHSRRAEVSYEEHAEDCYDNRWNVLDEQQNALEESNGGGGVSDSSNRPHRPSGPPVYEQFALRCRWGRIDAFVSEVNLVETLAGFMHAGLAVLRAEGRLDRTFSSCGPPRSSLSSSSSSSSTSFSSRQQQRRDPSSTLALQTCLCALEVWHSCCRQSDKANVLGLVARVRKLFMEGGVGLLDCIASSVGGNDDGGSSGGDGSGNKIGVDNTAASTQKDTDTYLRGSNGIDSGDGDAAAADWLVSGVVGAWWRLTAEACRRDRGLCDWLCTAHNLPNKCLVLLLKSPSSPSSSSHSRKVDYSSTVWALRVWRVCVCYGHGLASVSELLLAAQLMPQLLPLPNCLADSNLHDNDTVGVRGRGREANMTDQSQQPLPLPPPPSSSPSSELAYRHVAVVWLLEQAVVTAAAVVDACNEHIERAGGHLSQTAAVEERNAADVEVALELANLLVGYGDRLWSVSSIVTNGDIALFVCAQSHARAHVSSVGETLLRASVVHFMASLYGISQLEAAAGPAAARGQGLGDGGQSEGVGSQLECGATPTLSDHALAAMRDVCGLRQHRRAADTGNRHPTGSPQATSIHPFAATAASTNNNSRDDTDGSGSAAGPGFRFCGTRSSVKGSPPMGLCLFDACRMYIQHSRISHTMPMPLSHDATTTSHVSSGITSSSSTTTTTSTPTHKKLISATLQHLESKISRMISVLLQQLLPTSQQQDLDNDAEALLTADGSEVVVGVAGTRARAGALSSPQAEWASREVSLARVRLLAACSSFVASSSSSATSSSAAAAALKRALRALTAPHLHYDMLPGHPKQSSPSSLLPPAVARGLYVWQMHRLLQAERICILQVRLAAASAHTIHDHRRRDHDHDQGMVLTAALRCLCALSQGMKRQVIILAHASVDAIFEYGGHHQQRHHQHDPMLSSCLDLPPPAPTTQCSASLDRVVKNKVLWSILGDKDEAENRVSFAELSVLLPKPDCPTNRRLSTAPSTTNGTNLADWKNDCHDSKLPVPADWPLQCLFDLSGPDFNQWLTALSSLDGYTAVATTDGMRDEDENESSRGDGDGGGGGAVVDSSSSVTDGGVSVLGDDDIQVLYTLLRLVCTEHGHRWVTIDLDPIAVRQNPVAQDNHFSDRCASGSIAGYRLHEPSPTAVGAYCHLLTACCQRIAAAISQRSRLTHIQGLPCGSPVMKDFVRAAQREVSAALGSVGVRRLQEHRDLSRLATAYGFGLKAEAGAMELCGKVLDACTSQQIDGLVHCGSVLVLLSPLLSPWRLRERVWRHLADLRLLHLVENPGLIEALLPVLETPATPSIQSPPPPPAAPPATHSSDVSSAVDGRDNGLQGKQQLTGDGQRRKGSATNALVNTAIVAALSSLRSDEDRQWLICSVGLYHIASSLFPDTSICYHPRRHRVDGDDDHDNDGDDSMAQGGQLITVTMFSGSAELRQLKELIQNTPAVSDWIIEGVLLALHHCLFEYQCDNESTRASSRTAAHPWTAEKILSFHEASRRERRGTSSTETKTRPMNGGDTRLRWIQKIAQLIIWEGHDKTTDTLELFLELHRPQLL